MVAIYARQSVDKKDSISIETQIDLCRREIQGGEEIAVYSDKGYSGSSLNRPEFQNMLEDVKSGRLERIVTYRLDRISRSVLDFANLVDMFERHGVSFNSTQEKFDTGTPIGKAMLNITMVFAQLERETIQRRIRDNYYSRGEKGMFLGGPPPFGFIKAERHTEKGRIRLLEANPEAAPILKKLFIMYGDELCSLGEVARRMNEKAIPSPNGKNWDSSKISRVLRNPAAVKADVDVYNYYRLRGCRLTNEVSDFTLDRGCYLYGRREGHERKYADVTGHTLSLAPHEGLISPGLFLRCQKRLDANRQIGNRRRSKITWLTGLLKCGGCGYSAVPKPGNGGRYTYLYCTGRANLSGCDVEGNLGSLGPVEAAIKERIFHWARRYSGLRSGAGVAEDGERNRLRVRMEEIGISIQKLIDLAVTSGDITSRYLDERLSELERERGRLEKELAALNDKRNEKPIRGIADIEAEWEGLELSQKNVIAALIIDHICLYKDGIEIEWKFDFDI